ncbi:rab-GTPase-TBC domain-containing protein [Dichotomocladium elegans]|nr:rab-GTPase-TBC domain-containing protein [Dichotomocladium elegans]
MLTIASNENNDTCSSVVVSDHTKKRNSIHGAHTPSNQQHHSLPHTPLTIATNKRPRGMTQSLKNHIDKVQASHLQADGDACLFDRLQEENARLSPQACVNPYVSPAQFKPYVAHDSTTFILAQIQRQNTLLQDTNEPKNCRNQSIKNNTSQQPTPALPRSLQQNNVNDEEDIDWDFWEAVVQDFDRVALEMPHLLSVKLRAGVPASQRGLIWQAMCKSGSLHLETVYGQLCKEQSPCERIIQRDLARTFPYIDMFKQENGAGQAAMRRILEAYSLYDADVGYCQGLAFLVGPLLMHMPEVQAFCVFVRLMETYEMRPMFTLNMEGLQLRLYQFNSLLKELAPNLADHMEANGVHAAMYASQWFLTLFAYGFPLPLVERIYDIVFAEGAAETIMRVAIAMLRRSEQKILQETEFEDLLDHVTSHKLCEAYENDAAIIRDATALSCVINREKMESLAREYAMNIESDSRLGVTPTAAENNNSNGDPFPGKFGFFWKRKKPSPAMKSQQLQLKRSNSGSGSSIKKRWSSVIPSSGTSHQLQQQQQQQQQETNSRASFSSVRSYSSSFLMVDAPYANNSKYITIDQHEQEMQRLNWSLAQLSTKHQQVLDELAELKIDKKDVESERDALKITVKELEKIVAATVPNHKKISASLYGGEGESLIDEDESSSFHSGDGSPDGFSDITSQSVATTMAFNPETNDGGEVLRAELVRVKVENFELQQQCEKLSQDLEDVQSRLDMVNDGQMALVEKLILTKADMDVLMKEKKAKDLEWIEATQENKALKEELGRLWNQPLTFLGPQSNQDTVSRIFELERSLADAKLRLAEHEANDDLNHHQQQQQRVPAPSHHGAVPDIKRRVTIDHAPNADIKMRPVSVDARSMTRSSIYGKVWHALTPRVAGILDAPTAIKVDHE